MQPAAMSTEGLQRLFELTSDAVFVDCEGRIVAVNDAGVALYRAGSADEIIGRRVPTLAPEQLTEHLEGRAVRLRQGTETDHWSIEEILAFDGATVPVEVRSTPVTWEDSPASLVLIRELEASRLTPRITKRLGAALEVFSSVSLKLLRADGHELDATIEDVLAEIAVAAEVDRAYVIRFTDDEESLWCSHEWCAPGIEAQRDYVQGLPMKDFTWSHQIVMEHGRVHVPDLAQLPPEAASERESLGRYDVRSLLTVPMVVDGRVRGLVGFNAVHRKAVWPEPVIEQVAAVADAIGTALTRRNAAQQIAWANEQERRAQQLRDRFLARISHELRTPLNSVLGFTELLLLDEKDDQRRGLLHQVQESGTELLKLVTDVLDLSDLEAGDLELEKVDVDLADVVREAAGIAGVAADQYSVTLDVVPPAQPVVVCGDRQRILDIVVQLISNGILHNRLGGSVTVSCGVIDGTTRLDVSDTGRGMTAEQIDRAFEPFDRLEASAEIPGSGLGLTLVRLLLDRMGAGIDVQSTVGEGTTVSITF